MAIIQRLKKGNATLVREWTEIWSYRTKSSLINEIMYQFHEQYELYPIIGRRGGYKQVQISLDTATGTLIVHIEGEIQHATDETADLHEVRATFSANLIYNPLEGVIKFLVEISGGE